MKSNDDEQILEEGTGKEALPNELYRFEYVVVCRNYKVSKINNEYYITPNAFSSTVGTETKVLSEKDLMDANYTFLKIGELLQELKISDIYDNIDYIASHQPDMIDLIERFTSKYGPLDILSGILSPVLSLDLPIQSMDIIKQIQVLRPDEYLFRKYVLDKSNSDFYSDPTFYRKNTKEIKMYIAERQSIRTDIIKATVTKYGNQLPLISIGELMPMFFPNNNFDIMSCIKNASVFFDWYDRLYHEPLYLFLLCAKLYKLFWDGIGYFLKEYDRNTSSVVNIVPFATSIDLTLSPFLRTDKNSQYKEYHKKYLMGFKHRFINLFEAMQATYIKQVIHKDTTLITCKQCGKPIYMTKSNAVFCSPKCHDNFSESTEFVYS